MKRMAKLMGENEFEWGMEGGEERESKQVIHLTHFTDLSYGKKVSRKGGKSQDQKFASSHT